MTKIVFGLLIILTACTGSHDSEELQKIDSLSMVLDETELMFAEIEIDSLSKFYSVFQSNSDDIKTFYNKEDEEEWQTICRYSDLKKPFRNVVEYYDNIITELEYTRQQLDSLKFDLENNLLSEEQQSKYIADEEKAVGYLHQTVYKNLATSKVVMKDFDSLNTLVEKVIVKIK